MSKDSFRPVVRRRKADSPSPQAAQAAPENATDDQVAAATTDVDAPDQADAQAQADTRHPALAQDVPPQTAPVPTQPAPKAARKEERIPRRNIDEPMPSTDDFAAMFGETDFSFQEFATGDQVRAIVVAIDDNNVFVDLGAKSEGSVDRNDLIDKEGNLPVQIGDTLELYVVSTRGGTIQLSNALRQVDPGTNILEEAHVQHIPVDGKVTGVNKGGFDVEIAGKRAFCPMSQLTLYPIDAPETFIGTTHTFLVTRIDSGARNVVVSARQLQEEQRQAKAQELLDTLKVDMELQGTVSRITDFGAFVDLGGLDGLVHISELSWTRPDHPSDIVQEGQDVRVQVVRIDNDPKDGSLRIGLSMKSLEADPFVNALRNIRIGETLSGQVTRIMDFGAFVEIAPGVEGLVHISELDAGRRVRHPSDVVQVGDAVEVQVLTLDPQKRQIALSMARLMDDPWAQAAIQMPPGTEIQGTIEAVENFGAFVALENGLRALLPWSQLGEGEDRHQHKLFSVGNVISARVLDVDVARSRMSLTRRNDNEAQNERAAVRAQLRKQEENEGSFGTFADLLKNLKR